MKQKLKTIYEIFRIILKYPKVGIINSIRFLFIINNIKKNMIGRYCGSLTDQFLQVISTANIALKYPNQTNILHIEIGILFGGSVLAKLKALELIRKENHKIVAIDPFQGYYNKKNDPYSGLPVTLNNFKKNLSRFKIKSNKVIIFKSISNNSSIIKSLNKKFYKVLSLMIDGDHSYNGVKLDWNKYTPLIITNGICILDDYRDPSWKEVTRFGDEIIHNTSWKTEAQYDTTLILKQY